MRYTNWMERENKYRRDLFPGALEMMILRTLKRQPMNGYALAQEIRPASGSPEAIFRP